jgi:hypothetical protein
MEESASCRAGVVRARPPTIQRSAADGVAEYFLFAIRNKNRELRETNVGAAYGSCVCNSFNSSSAFEGLMIQEMPYSNGCWSLPLVAECPP